MYTLTKHNCKRKHTTSGYLLFSALGICMRFFVFFLTEEQKRMMSVGFIPIFCLFLEADQQIIMT